ncbi:sensor histidine kinase [Alkalinema pantanalense CENA528]|uniref:sensor histidine kinase n=1 Tax=Alkalinema pantanalense TaxID=1620705 RepID=UPI003D6E202B
MRFELTSTISELKSWEAQLEIQEIGQCLIVLFDQDPLLPGVVLTRDRGYQGMISRRHFFEQMSRPYSLELFSRHPLERFCDAWATEPLILPGTTSIVEATQQALQRSADSIYEPILMETASGSYRVLDFHELLLAYSQVHTLSLRSLQQAQQEAQLVEANLRQLQYNYSRHLQTEKMAALGQLVAGVAHEINNPTSFIYGNLNHVDRYIRDFLEVIALYQSEYPQPSPVVQAKLQELDFDFLTSDIIKLVRSMRVGAERITEIVKSLRNFSRLDESDYKAVDIHDGIDSTIMILRSRLKSQTKRPEIQVTKDYGLLPSVECYAGQLNQVFMNILSNAIDAIEEQIEQYPQTVPIPQGNVHIKTQQMDNEWIMISIADNGSGIPESIQNQLFDPFFTTKAIGKGTGLGLYISHQIIKEKHHGKLTCRSSPQGTEFLIQIPICQTRTCPPVRAYALAID